MKLLLIILSVFVTSMCFAKNKENITLDMVLKIDGEIVSSPKISTLSGNTASVEMASEEGDGAFIKVTPVLKNNNEVHMDISISQIKNGKKLVLAQPKLISLLGKKAEIDKDLKDEESKRFSFAVTATL